MDFLIVLSLLLKKTKLVPYSAIHNTFGCSFRRRASSSVVHMGQAQ
jgi:hypothetical protein